MTSRNVTDWIDHHLLAAAALLVLGVGTVLGMAAPWAWPFILPLPIVFAALAWFGWEFSSEAVPAVIGIVIFSYLGLAVGAALCNAGRRTK